MFEAPRRVRPTFDFLKESKNFANYLLQRDENFSEAATLQIFYQHFACFLLFLALFLIASR